jgi:hypothetical protein
MESEDVLPFLQQGATAACLELNEFSVQCTAMCYKTYFIMFHVCAGLPTGAF